MKVAITGLTGFLGHYVAKRLFAKEIEIVSLARSVSNTLHLKDYEKKIAFIRGDMTDKETLRKFLHGADVVIHMAYERNGASFHEAANRDLKRFVEANLLGSIELLDASRRAGIKQCIFISSCAVYGHIFPGIKLDELHPLLPDSNYGAYKASVEAFCHSYFMSKAFDVTIFRPVGIYGINPHLAHSAWYNIAKDIRHGINVEVSGGGKVVHVEDVAQAIDLAIGNKEAAGKVYNLVDFYVDNISVARMVRDICDSGSHVSGTPRQPIHTIENAQSRAFGVSYTGMEGLKGYLRELIKSMS
ncbi:MAG: NAD(P)-dependent oxidoreductase [Candidatus Brocadia sp.]|uniref:Epimerase/dehydratase n=1 Tax=Candidatus Brocadia fulgida TaxID=380242 RepID=A0A0M2UYW4_9BACT|nr:MAG: putative epimerase/dehydratase [Candidatus Brocadia fulgida]UJS19556.1 MAG: NAD(P)-dependent oxidoreductase [Candidatus Brocadia sp.]